VDLNVLWRLVLGSVAGGVGLTIAFSVVIYGAARFVDLRRGHHHALAGLFGLLALVALAVVAGGTLYGISILADKD
jgi:hypothetical protein